MRKDLKVNNIYIYIHIYTYRILISFVVLNFQYDKMQPGCRAAVEDAYIRHSNENKLDPPTITEAPPRHPRVNACDPDVRWVKGRP